MTAAIALHDLVKHYRRDEHRAPRTPAVDKLSLAVPHGQILALLGRHGAGKTTLLRLLCGTIRATSGRIVINGHDLALNRDLALRQIGVAPGPCGGPRRNLSIEQALARASGASGGSAVAERLLSEVGLWPRRDMAIRCLSHGMQWLLDLALAACGGAPILLLDDPLAGLERRHADAAKRWLRQLARDEGRTIVLASARPDDLRDLCDRAIILDHGTFVADVAPAHWPITPWHDDRPYRVRVHGHLGTHGAAWFADLTVANAPDGTAELSGRLADQAALYGLLARLQNLGLPLLAIERGPPDPLALALAQADWPSFEGQVGRPNESSR